MANSNSICFIDDCTRPANGSWGMCRAHYARLLRYGTPFSGGRFARLPGMTIDEIIAMHTDLARYDGAGCLIPNCTLSAQGYAVISLNKRRYTLSRLILSKKLGRQLSKAEVTRHTCDNRACINAEHLIPGSHADNTRDMDSRGRRRIVPMIGEAHPMAKLSETGVKTIRERYAAGNVTMKILGDEFGVSFHTVSDIIRRRSWRHLS